MTKTEKKLQLKNNYLLAYDSYVPLYNRFHRGGMDYKGEWGGGGPGPTTHSISCLDSSLGRVPACDAGDPGSIPGGGKLIAWDTVPF
jgi:hypothetical protein